MLLAGYLAAISFGYAGGAPPYRLSTREALNLPLRWDAGWYLDIAANGYRSKNPNVQQNIVFFPAYPLAIRTVGWLFGGTLNSHVAAGLLISHVAFFFALVYLYALARDALDADGARFALWMIGTYPFAVFFGAIYTESLFLLTTTAIFFHVSRGHFGAAALWGLLAGLTRPPGSLMVIPLAVVAFQRRERKAWAAVAAPVLGMLVYSAFIWRLTGDPLAWNAGQEAWGRRFGPFDIRDYTDVLNDLGAAFAIAAAWPVARRFGAAYALFVLINTLPGLVTHGPVSAGRYSAVVFPVFLWLAAAVPQGWRVAWIASFALLQAVVAALFYAGRAIY